MRSALFYVFALVAFVVGVFAHPGHDIQAEALERRDFLSRNTPLQARCGKHLAASGFSERALQRRQKVAQSFRERRGLSEWPIVRPRDYTDALAKDHHSNLTGIDFSTDRDSLFGDKSSCLLQDEATEGPYYITGEYVRSNMTESQAGVPLVIDMQVIDVNTCEPYKGHYVDFWHCNSTGVYGGVVAGTNGNANDASNINNTFLRGIQPTDDDGVVQMETIFPGHYAGRTPHVHILVHGSGMVLANKTLSGSTVAHVGQLFFDQALITAVEKNTPYSTNKQSLVLNSDDGILKAEAKTTDPMVEYVYAGSDVSDGIVAWITVGVNGTLSKSVVAAGNYDDAGGHTAASRVGNGRMGSGGPPSSAPADGTSLPSETVTSQTTIDNSLNAATSGAAAGSASPSSNESPNERSGLAKFALSCLLALLV